MFDVYDWGQELAQIRRRVDERVYESACDLDRWRQDAEQRLGDVDTAALDTPVERVAVPGDAPRQYHEVLDKFDTGELDWESVMAGTVEDEGGRAMSLWMDRRLQQIELVGRLVRRGTTIEDAYAEVTGRKGR